MRFSKSILESILIKKNTYCGTRAPSCRWIWLAWGTPSCSGTEQTGWASGGGSKDNILLVYLCAMNSCSNWSGREVLSSFSPIPGDPAVFVDVELLKHSLHTRTVLNYTILWQHTSMCKYLRSIDLALNWLCNEALINYDRPPIYDINNQINREWRSRRFWTYHRRRMQWKTVQYILCCKFIKV